LGWLGQPPVIGEVLGGICLGPSLLGKIAPEVAAYILPQSVAPMLSVIAQIGVVLYMFLVGLEVSADLRRDRVHAAVATSHASIVAPFVLGAALSLFLYPRLATSDVPFTSFALFMAVAMSITAFPVLARILTDRRMTRSELGVVALSCAAADDVTAWCLLAFVVGVTQSTAGAGLTTTALAIGFIALMFGVVRPVASRILARPEMREPGRDAIALSLIGVLLAALATEQIGVHAIFGAFLFGAVIPHDSALTRTLTEKLEAPVTILLLPAFFAFTGMRTEIALLSGGTALALCSLIIVVATLGKFGGTLAAARVSGMGWRDAASLGVLMNTRGLMELIVLNIGLDLGVISPQLFAMMVLMALVTTLATTPILQWLHPALQSAPLNAVSRRAAGGV
jgi:Kef-type K+ transport system membrane component KefB